MKGSMPQATADRIEAEGRELARMYSELCRAGLSDQEAALTTDYELATRIANRRRARRGLPGPASEAEIDAVLASM